MGQSVVWILQEASPGYYQVVAVTANTATAYAELAEGRFGDGPFTVVSVHREGIRLEEPKRKPRRKLVWEASHGGRPERKGPGDEG